MLRFLEINIQLLMCVLILSGCSTSGHYDLLKYSLVLPYSGGGNLLVVSQDKRQMVVEEVKPSTYIGRKFNGTGIPAQIQTRTGKPVAEDIGQLIAAALEANGFNVDLINVENDLEIDLAEDIFNQQEFERILILQVNEFRAESFVEVELQWDFDLLVYDRQKKLMATINNKGFEDKLFANYTGAVSGGQAQHAILKKLGAVLHEMMGAVEIKDTFATIRSTDVDQLENVAAERPEKLWYGLEREYLQMQDLLEKGNIVKFNKIARVVYTKGISNQKEMDQFAGLIWEQKESMDKSVVDGLCYLCKAFILSNHPRYRSFFETMSRDGKTRKLRRYCRKVARSLPEAMGVEQFVQ